MNRNEWKKSFLKADDVLGTTKVIDNAILDRLDISYFADGPTASYWVSKSKRITVEMRTLRVDSLAEFKREFKRPIALYQLRAYDGGGYLIRFGEV